MHRAFAVHRVSAKSLCDEVLLLLVLSDFFWGQDAVCVYRRYGGNPDQLFFGVFDGHGQQGTSCAQFAKDQVCVVGFPATLHFQHPIAGSHCLVTIDFWRRYLACSCLALAFPPTPSKPSEKPWSNVMSSCMLAPLKTASAALQPLPALFAAEQFMLQMWETQGMTIQCNRISQSGCSIGH